MFALFVFLIKQEVKPNKKPITVQIDIKNKVNICLPEDEYDLETKKIDNFENNR